MATRYSIAVYVAENGSSPFEEWLGSLRDGRGKIEIMRRIDRIGQGNLGDHHALSGADGVAELRICCGPGYRVYYGMDGDTVILLLCAGDKKTQNADIKKAKAYWTDYKRRKQ